MHSTHNSKRPLQFSNEDYACAYNLLKNTGRVAEKTKETSSCLPQTPIIVFGYLSDNKNNKKKYKFSIPALDIYFNSNVFREKICFQKKYTPKNEPPDKEWSILPSTKNKLADYFSLIRNPAHPENKFLKQMIENYKFSLSKELADRGIPIESSKEATEAVTYETSSNDET